MPLTVHHTHRTLDSHPMCPHCESTAVIRRHLGRKTIGTLGTVAGSVTGGLSAWVGAEIGLVAGAVAGPVGMPAGALLGALIGSLVGGTSGCIAGSTLGQRLDEQVLDSHRCLDCGFTFSPESAPQTAASRQPPDD